MAAKATTKPRKSIPDASEIVVAIAMLEQQAEQTTERFEVLGEKFDRILSKVEELALHTTSLNTRHDTQIQVLQKQMASTELAITQTRDEITKLTTSIPEHVRQEIVQGVHEVAKSVNELSQRYNQLDTRLQSLERWRMLLIGGGIVAGALIMRVLDIFTKSLTGQ